MREIAAAAVALLALAGAGGTHAQQQAIPLPLVRGAAVVQTLSFPEGDRESVLSVDEVSPEGTRWTWSLVEIYGERDTVVDRFAFVEGAADVVSAFRYLSFHGKEGPIEHPGYTMMAISRAVYRRLRTEGVDSFQVMELTPPADAGGALQALGGPLGRKRWVPVRWRGTLSAASPAPTPFALLVNGRRTEVPALHLRGSFVARGRRFEPQIWVLADSTYPLVLKWIGHSAQPTNVLQTVRVDFPAGPGPTEAEGAAGGELERALGSECRVELPGIYFAFNSAVLDPASDRTIGTIAEILARHPDWLVTIEGHTDSIGSAASNQALSERRAGAVRDRLVGARRVDASRLRTNGYGSSRPREPNATVEGRARNRRVELVRPC